MAFKKTGDAMLVLAYYGKNGEKEECSKCGEEYFDEDQAENFANKIDKEKERIEAKVPLKVESGTLII